MTNMEQSAPESPPEPTLKSIISQLPKVATPTEMMALMKKSVHHGYRKIFKDIEIERRDMALLLMITFGIICFAGINLYFSGSLIEYDATFGGTGITLGAIAGIVFGGIIVDRLERKFPVLIAFLGSSPLFTVWGYYARGNPDIIFSRILLAVNLTLSIILIITMAVMYVQYTTMLERGRVLALAMSISAIMTILLMLFILNGIFVLIPTFFPVITAIWLYRHQKQEKVMGHFTLLEKTKDIEKFNRQSTNPSDSKKIEEIKKPVEDEGKLYNLNDFIADVKNVIKNRASRKKFLQFLRTNDIMIKYLIVMFLYGGIIGLLIPIENIYRIIAWEQAEGQLMLLVVIVSTILIAIAAFSIGLIFDFQGRKTTLTVIVLVIGVANFWNGILDVIALSNQQEIKFNQNIPVLIAAIFILFLAIPLLNGDISQQEFYGRTTALWMFSAIIGIIIGVVYKTQLFESSLEKLLTQIDFAPINLEEMVDAVIYQYSITSVVFLACIILLFILANISYDMSKDEQNWPDSLIHMYIIHYSGLLLYEHTFREEKDLATADLVSGGLIGLVNMLKEITHGSQDLRIIDHGDKKLLFQWDSQNQVVFVTVIQRELVIIRHKLMQFIAEFEEKYGKYLKNFQGVDDSLWNTVKDLVNMYFTRKYLSLQKTTKN